MDPAQQRQWLQDELARLVKTAQDHPSDDGEGATYTDTLATLGFDGEVFRRFVDGAVLGCMEGNGVAEPLSLWVLQIQPWLAQTFVDIAFFMFVLGHGWNAQRATDMREVFGDKTTTRTALEIAGYMRRAIEEVEGTSGREAILSDAWVTARLKRWAEALEAGS
jgi:hypothetical protein